MRDSEGGGTWKVNCCDGWGDFQWKFEFIIYFILVIYLGVNQATLSVMIWTIPTHVININLLFSGNLHILLYINIHFQLYKTMTNLFFSVYIALCVLSMEDLTHLYYMISMHFSYCNWLKETKKKKKITECVPCYCFANTPHKTLSRELMLSLKTTTYLLFIKNIMKSFVVAC